MMFVPRPLLVSLLLPTLSRTRLFRCLAEAAATSEEDSKNNKNNNGVGSDNVPVGDSHPRLTYGTAWKKDATADLVYNALMAGFRHVDTACQPKHYNEAGVGEGWTRAAHDLGLHRNDIWLQTKYTSIDGQDRNQPLPYDPNASKEDQVRQSLATSLENLQTDYVDSLVMHGPEQNWEDMFKVWNTMEELVDEGKVKQIGISNLYHPPALVHLYEHSRIKPSVVQNRFYDATGYDVSIRKFCLQHEIEYQTFWTLSSRHFTTHPVVKSMSKERHVSPETLLYALVMKLGHTPLDGTKNHMDEDMELLHRIKNGEVIISDEELPQLLEILGVKQEEEEDAEEL